MSHYHSSYVKCPACKKEHFTDSKAVVFVDCYEGDRGQDVYVYVCPVTKKQVESNVYRAR